MKTNKSILLFFILSTFLFLLCSNVTSSPGMEKEKISGNALAINTADTNSLKKSVAGFLAKVDSAKIEGVIPYYDSSFVSIRVADEGGLVKMNYNQMIYFWKMLAGKQPVMNFSNISASTKNTIIHYVEIINNTGYVLMTRVKDLGNGPETLFYNLIWIYKNDKWYLLREIVHQKTLPKFH